MADRPGHPIPHPLPHPDLAGYVLDRLDPAEAQAFARHLADCPVCRSEVAELSGLPALLDSLAAEPPDELRRRTLAAVGAARGSTRGDTRAARSVSDGGPDWWQALRRRPVVAAAAAVLLIVLGAIVFAGRDAGPGGAVTVPLAAVAGESGKGQATIRRGPEGLVIRLSVDGLEPNRPGTYYECWYVGEQDSARRPSRVSGGTFTVGADGAAEVTLTTAADYRRYPGIAITQETDDGDPGTTGPVILVSR